MVGLLQRDTGCCEGVSRKALNSPPSYAQSAGS